MAYTHTGIEVLFLSAVIILWGMIFYQMMFTFLVYVYHQRSLREQRELDRENPADLPPVSVLIPAHNEALVIEQTLRAIRALHYPEAQLEIIVINDGSTDGTAEIVTLIGR